jgi:hypothetical protein
VLDTLRALGGSATLGDLVAITGLFRGEIVTALERLLSSEQVHVRVSDDGGVVYHLGGAGAGGRPSVAPRAPSPRSARVAFDRKTLRLIRAREGVLSMAELVEHTGLLLAEAEREMARLARSYGGVPHASLDDHVVWAFPELMSSASGRFPVAEPRPAWVRAEDPMRTARWGGGTGLGRLLRRLGLPAVRLPGRATRTLRRYVLGHVIQTALAGKGVVSLSGAVRYLEARKGGRGVRRSSVEAALRQLAAEFDAPMHEMDGELFFGFRTVKRQFLASLVVRRRIRLRTTVSGRTVFDTADSPLRASERDLETFDRELARPRWDRKKSPDAVGSGE